MSKKRARIIRRARIIPILNLQDLNFGLITEQRQVMVYDLLWPKEKRREQLGEDCEMDAPACGNTVPAAGEVEQPFGEETRPAGDAAQIEGGSE